ncbi:hypothetical protein ID144_15960 [Pseudomonas sp. JM0905a]|uniref:TadG family pilus assembly protein n=1 Tax=Pseudomonas sp. JM0905a TaxID=2772484 RepID=UPI0016835A12|nr:TadG family pilus assembly protein [Pseudomonas sp. JM0905a]MBD2838541.1 hypothetical protein [Pseudomonas sp. JM0905a]
MHSLRRQRGAIGLMATLVLLLTLMMLALTVDAGRLYFEKRKLQRVADMAAMESASRSGLCGTTTAAEVVTLADAAAARHGYSASLGGGNSGNNSVRLGYVELDGAEERRVFTPSATRAEAVRVLATQEVPASLVLGGLWGERVNLQAVAVAQRPALAAFSLGSGLASLDPQQSAVLDALLGKMLGTTLTLDAASYDGLANTRLNLLELNRYLPPAAQVDLSAGDVDRLLDTTLTLDQVLDATVGAANSRETLSVGVRNGLNSLTNVTLGATQVKLADILDVVTPAGGGEQALRTDLSALDLVTALAFLANKAHAVDVALGVSLGSLVNAKVELYVVEPPKIAIGLPGKDVDGQWRTQATTAQVRLQVSSDMDVSGLLTVRLGLALNVAEGWAALDQVDCGSILPGERSVQIKTQPGIASLGLGTFQSLGGSQTTLNPVSVTLIPSLLGVSVNISSQTQVASASAEDLEFTFASNSQLPLTQRAGSDVGDALDAGLSNLVANLNVTVSGVEGRCHQNILNCFVSGLTTLLNPLTSAWLRNLVIGALQTTIPILGDTLIEPLLRLLGVELGYADVRLIDLDTSAPQLLL